MARQDKVRIGIVGCGMATMVMYTPVMRHVACAEVTALCDPFPAALELTGSPPFTSGLDGRKAIEAINAVYLSAYLGEKVHLPLERTPDLERIFAEMKARSPRLD